MNANAYSKMAQTPKVKARSQFEIERAFKIAVGILLQISEAQNDDVIQLDTDKLL
jgi:hypothetical protein